MAISQALNHWVKRDGFSHWFYVRQAFVISTPYLNAFIYNMSTSVIRGFSTSLPFVIVNIYTHCWWLPYHVSPSNHWKTSHIYSVSTSVIVVVFMIFKPSPNQRQVFVSFTSATQTLRISRFWVSVRRNCKPLRWRKFMVSLIYLPYNPVHLCKCWIFAIPISVIF